MKKTIFCIILLLGTAIGVKAQENTTPNPANPNAPKFKFESEVIDYGTIEYKSDGNREFKFTNVGKEPLIINDISRSCGCTTPQWPKEPIMPGATAVIKVHYATDRVGMFEKTITISSNADTPSKMLRIKGNVKPEVALEKKAIPMENK